ncbi:GNAT family N-acetyltransferase [Streptomyces sp. NPDC054866]
MTVWEMRLATQADVERMAALRALVMREDFERVGRYDEQQLRQRVRDRFTPGHCWVIEVADAFAGCVSLRPDRAVYWLEHFLVVPPLQGRGIGSAVLHDLLERCDHEGIAVWLYVLQGSPARRLYERHGFTLEPEDPPEPDSLLITRQPA